MISDMGLRYEKSILILDLSYNRVCMTVGLLIIAIHIYNALSLKDKRKYVKSIKDKITNHFKISVSEVEFHNSWQRSKIGAVVIGTDKESVNSYLSSIINFVQKYWPDLLVNISKEFINI